LHLTAKNECMHCIEELIKAWADVKARIAEGLNNWMSFH
jgi:hypothetical protein